MKLATTLLLASSALTSNVVHAQDTESSQQRERERIVVTGERWQSEGATKTDVPAIEVPQPVTVITDELFEAQGAVSISDTLNYVAGVHSNPYGPDSRVDSAFVRGIDALQFRDGMRDIFSFYASIRADPYNFSQVEVIRGPASVLFGAGSLGGIVNLVSKTPQFNPEGEMSVRYGSFDRIEAMADVTGPITDTVAARLVGRVRDAGTQTDFVPDDRVLLSPSITWAPTMDTELTLIGLYQEDDGGSTSQFLPLVGTILPNPNGQLDSDLFVGKPGWDRYDGRLAQGTALLTRRVSDAVRFNFKARYIDSDLTYFTHYPNNYTSPTNPYLDVDQRLIGLYSDGSQARMEVFSTDNNLQLTFDTGSAIEHILLAGIDYSRSRVRKTGGFGYEVIDIYDIDYDAINGWDGGLPQPEGPSQDVTQKQLGVYLQDQIRFWDRVSIVLGVRHDEANASDALGGGSYDTSATSFRAGIIGEIRPGLSPFASYTESFEPIAGVASNGAPFVPKQGRQYEAGIKFHPNPATLVTATVYDIVESNRPVSDDSTPDLSDQIQVGELTSRGFELEAITTLPGAVTLIANYSYNEAEISDADIAQAALIGNQLDNVPKHNASLWATRPFQLTEDLVLTLGGGLRYAGDNTSYGPAFPNGIETPGHTLVDAYAALDWPDWSLSLNATNLFDDNYYSACLARGDCFQGAERNVYATLTRRF